MTVVNFNITKPLEKKIDKIIKDQGFASKAEFFRFSALFFIHNMSTVNRFSDEEYEQIMQDLAAKLSKKYRNKKLPSLEKQLDDL